MWDPDPFKSPTKTALLTTVMLLPHSFSPGLRIIEKSSDLEGYNPGVHDNRGLDFLSPQLVYRNSDGLVEDGKTSLEWLDDSPKKKRYFEESDEGLDEGTRKENCKIIDKTGMKCSQLFWE